MLKKLVKFASALAVFALVATAGTNASIAADLELVVGSGSTSGELFRAGSGLSVASVMHGKGIKIYNYGTKGDKDNIKRLTKKKRAINLALVSAKGLAKANDKQKKAMSGLMAVGKSKGDTVLLIVRNKGPKGVSKADYASAVAEVVRVLKNPKSAAVIKGQWSGWSVSSGDAAFKAAGVKVHKAAM